MQEIDKGALLAEGKTKYISEAEEDGKVLPGLVVIENKEDITANDNPDLTKQFKAKAEFATSTTCRVFELLRAAGIPVAYREQLSETEFLADKCRMIPLEVVARRHAFGSFLKRNPHLTQTPPLRFSRLVTEFFLKTSHQTFINDDGDIVILGLSEAEGVPPIEDPLISDAFSPGWQLLHPKKPVWDSKTLSCVSRQEVIGDSQVVEMADDLIRRVFLVLEGAWANLGYRLVDIKLEFGWTPEGVLVVADVVDGDSWRLVNQGWEDFSKQSFRDGEALDEVERKYGLVASLAEQFRIPQQVLVLWRGSEHDEVLNVTELPVEIGQVILSGHKATKACLLQLTQLERNFQSGVIIAKVGMSNGLGPILAAHTNWPVIAIPDTMMEFPEDVWSSLRMPSNVPLLVCNERNAVNAALNILSQNNPLLYMKRRLAIEALDY